MTQPSPEQDWTAIVRYGPFCLTVTHGVTPRNLLERYEADPTTARLLAFGETDAVVQPGPDRTILTSGTLGDWTFGFETMSVEGVMPETLAALSRGTQTLALNDSANAMHTLKHWVDGQPQESFEIGNPVTQRAAGPHPLWDATERHRATHPDQSDIVAALRAVNDHIGGHLAPRMLARPLLTAMLPERRPPLSAPRPALPLVHPRESTPLGQYLGTLRPPEER